MATKFVSFDRLKRYTQHVKSYVGQQILNAKGEWAKQLNLKVDKVEGKGLSTNDFTTELKNKLNGIEAGAQVNTVTGIKGNAESAYRKGDVNLTPANIGAVASSNGDASNTKVTFMQSTSRVNLTSGDTLKTAFGKLSKWFVDLKAVAFSGSYNDLSNKPTTLKNPKSLTIQQNGGNQTEYDGSTALTVNITKAGIGLGNVENKSSATIRSELTSSNVTTALGYTPINSSATELTNQNLDGYKGTDYMGKMYYAAGGNSVTGKPSGVDNFWMWVTRNGVGAFSQILMDNKCQLHTRYHNANSWSTWKQVISSGDNISLLNNDRGYQTLQQVEDKINSIISSEIGQITTFSFQVVEELPSSGTSNHIYLVPISGSTESDNYYEEYCYINSKWELIGTTKVDLTAYAKKTDIPTKLPNPNALTIQLNGTSQGAYDGTNAKTINVTKSSIGLGNVENKSSATIRGEITASDIQDIGVTGVKGSSESTYRKGNVNITKANIGLSNVENKSSATIRGELTSSDVIDALGYTPTEDGNIPSKLPNPSALTLQANGTSLGSYDGSTAKTFNITKSNIGLGNVENKSSATIRSELTSSDIEDALGYIPAQDGGDGSTPIADNITDVSLGYSHSNDEREPPTKWNINGFLDSAKTSNFIWTKLGVEFADGSTKDFTFAGFNPYRIKEYEVDFKNGYITTGPYVDLQTVDVLMYGRIIFGQIIVGIVNPVTENNHAFLVGTIYMSTHSPISTITRIGIAEKDGNLSFVKFTINSNRKIIVYVNPEHEGATITLPIMYVHAGAL